MGHFLGGCQCPWAKRDILCTPSCFVTRFLGSLRARLMLLHPSPNCSLRAESLVHVHFKEEIGVAELIPLVTTYIILFAYIYFSTRRSMAGGGGFLQPNGHSHTTPFPASGGDLHRDEPGGSQSQDFTPH